MDYHDSRNYFGSGRGTGGSLKILRQNGSQVCHGPPPHPRIIWSCLFVDLFLLFVKCSILKQANAFRNI